MANSSDWIAALALQPHDDKERSATSEWIAALGQQDAADTDFCETYPWQAEPAIAPLPEPAPEAGDPAEAAYAQGYAEGLAQGRAQMEERVADHDDAIAKLRLSFTALDQAAMTRLTRELGETVLALCEPVLRDYAIDEAAFEKRCEAASVRLGTVPAKLVLHLHPEMLARLDPEWLGQWQVEPDPALARGALRIAGPDGTVREGPEDWMRAIDDALAAQ